MRMMSLVVCAAGLLLTTAGTAAAVPSDGEACRSLGRFQDAGSQAVRAPKTPTGGFDEYRKAMAAAVGRSGDKALAARLDGLVRGRPVPAKEAGLAGCLLRGYVVARYGDRMAS